ncbi:hypothetical protein QQZ08_007708 [Neonectria magnoliae]|uniref:Cytochrome P450 n=1 Tax=Neonectria magnoliae TaxID=2732573 RepID=A0ABR1HX60_9HYPO
MRTATTDTVLSRGGGPDRQLPLFIPKGTECRWSLYSLHRRKDIFGDDADEFRPERWEKLRATGGPRICIGKQFALTQISCLVTRLLQTFAGVEAADDGPMVQEVSTTMKIVGGCWVKMKGA